MRMYHAGLDVSDKTTSVCVMHKAGKPVLETEVETTPAAISAALGPYKTKLESVGLESGTKARWLYKELVKRRLRVICLDARLCRAALSAKRRKSDTSDARGLALLLCRGIFTTVHVKSDEAMRVQALLAMRKTLQRKALDLQGALRMTSKSFGGQKQLARDPVLSKLATALLEHSLSMLREVQAVGRIITRMAKADPVCRRLMTIPGVGPQTALAFRAAIDEPRRFTRSRNVGAYFGLIPRRYQSGQTDISGRITRLGSNSMRSLLYSAASSLITSSDSQSRLRLWALALRERRGFGVAVVACARRLAALMHRLWVAEQDFNCIGVR